MTYNSIQIEIGEFILAFLQQHSNHAERSELQQALYDRFGWNSSEPDYMLQSLATDWHFIEPWGTTQLKLTNEGDKAARRGLAKTMRRNSWWHRTMTYKKIAELLITCSTLIGVLASLMTGLTTR